MRTFREFISESVIILERGETQVPRKPGESKSDHAQRVRAAREARRASTGQDASARSREGMKYKDPSGRSVDNSGQGSFNKQGQTRTPPSGGGTKPPRKPEFKMPKVNMPKVTPKGAAAGALSVGLGALDYKQRRDAGQTRTQAGSGAAAAAGGGTAGWMTGAKLGASLPIPHPLGRAAATVTGGVLGSVLGSSGASALSDKLTGVNKTPTEKDYDKAKQKIGMTQSRQVASKAGVYGATKGSALTGTGGNTFTKKDAKGNAFMSTGTGSQRKTVQLAKTQLVRDPKTGQQRVGDLAFKGGKPVYLARPSVASRDVGLGGAFRNLSRATGIGGQRERDAAAAKQEYRTALKNTQAYTKGLGISTKSATAQKLPGYGTSPKPKPAPAPTPTYKPAGGGMGGRRGGRK